MSSFYRIGFITIIHIPTAFVRFVVEAIRHLRDTSLPCLMLIIYYVYNYCVKFYSNRKGTFWQQFLVILSCIFLIIIVGVCVSLASAIEILKKDKLILVKLLHQMNKVFL